MKGVIDRSSLCDKCQLGQVMQLDQGRVVFCMSLHRRVPDNVRSCSGYKAPGSTEFDIWSLRKPEGLRIDPRPQPPSQDKGYI